MSYVISCYKHVINEEDIKVNDDLSVSTERAERKISEYDKNAIEAGKQLALSLDATPACLTYGSEKARPSVKDALSRGSSEAFFINDESANIADPRLTGEVIATAIKKIEDVRVVVCADGSADVYQKQTASRVAALLDWPILTNVISFDVGSDQLVVTQKIDDGLRTVKMLLPCVLAVLPEVNSPPTPGMRDILNAGKKPVSEWSLDELGIDPTVNTSVVKVEGFVMQRKNEIFEDGDAEEKVSALIAALKKEGVL